MLGQCIKYNRTKGFGFVISTDDPTLPDFFVSYRNIDATKHDKFLYPGATVEFDPVLDTPTGPQAHHVRKVAVTIARQVGPGVRQ